MQRTGTVRTFIRPTHKSVIQNIVFLQVMIYLALANAKRNKNDPQTRMHPTHGPLAEKHWLTIIFCV